MIAGLVKRTIHSEFADGPTFPAESLGHAQQRRDVAFEIGLSFLYFFRREFRVQIPDCD